MAKTLPPLAELGEWLCYDAETGDFYWIKTPGRRTKAGQKAGWKNSKGYTFVTLNGKHLAAHRLAWLFVYHKDPGNHQIDHINCNPADNRICNLRIASNAENMRNTRKIDGTTSAYKGVTWYKRKQKWRAQIRLDGKSRHLGYFHDEEAAHAAYCAAADAAFGEFARFG